MKNDSLQQQLRNLEHCQIEKKKICYTQLFNFSLKKFKNKLRTNEAEN